MGKEGKEDLEEGGCWTYKMTSGGRVSEIGGGGWRTEESEDD